MDLQEKKPKNMRWRTIVIAIAAGASFMASVPVEDATSNISGWLKFFGWDSVPQFLSATVADDIVLGVGIATILALLIYWAFSKIYEYLRKKPKLELIVRGANLLKEDFAQVNFVVSNAKGTKTAKGTTVTFRLVEGVTAAKIGGGWIEERRLETFEPNGRVGVANRISNDLTGILPGHYSEDFFGLTISTKDHPPGSTFVMEYRIGAEDMEPVTGSFEVRIPNG